MSRLFQQNIAKKKKKYKKNTFASLNIILHPLILGILAEAHSEAVELGDSGS